MKTILRSLAIAAVLLAAGTMNAQDNSAYYKIHPDIEHHEKAYNLSAEQVEQMALIYKESATEMAALEKSIRKAQMTQQEKSKAATPAEREKMLKTNEALSQKRNVMKKKREDRFIEILTEEQANQYKSEMKSKPVKKEISPEEKQMKKSLSK